MKGLSSAIPVSQQATEAARVLYETYQRRALDQFGYPPRSWDVLAAEDKQLRCEAVQEMINAGRLLLLPACDHPDDAQELVRREMVVCTRCGSPVRMLERLAEGSLATGGHP